MEEEKTCGTGLPGISGTALHCSKQVRAENEIQGKDNAIPDPSLEAEAVKPAVEAARKLIKPSAGNAAKGVRTSKPIGKLSTPAKPPPALRVSTAGSALALRSSPSTVGRTRKADNNGNLTGDNGVPRSLPNVSSSLSSTGDGTAANSVKRRNSIGTPGGIAERRSSIGVAAESSITPRRRLASSASTPAKANPTVTESRRASLPNVSVKSVTTTTPADLKKLSASTSSSLISKPLSAKSSSVAASPSAVSPSLRSVVGKPTSSMENVRRNAGKPSAVSPRGTLNSPTAGKKKTTSALSETRTRTSASLDSGSSSLRKTAFSGPKHASSSLSTDRISSLSDRRRSLTPDSRDSRFIALPQVEVKAGDDVRLDLRGQKVRSLDSNVLSSPNLEFVYLRDNKLSTLVGIEILKRVKVLDLSFNEFKGSGFEPLVNCKALQQLYLAGNQITSLTGLPQLPNLEFLSVAQNKLKSLAMPTQPRLQVLAASKNKISTLKGFPCLPLLEHLRLEENPILEMPH